MVQNNTIAKSASKVEQKMQSNQFLYWLQGCFELGEVKTVSAKQIEILKKHMEITEDDHKFLTWLKGFLIGKESGLNKHYTQILKDELALCFTNITKELEKKSSLEELLKTFPKKDPPPFFPGPNYPWLDKDWKFDPNQIIC